MVVAGAELDSLPHLQTEPHLAPRRPPALSVVGDHGLGPVEAGDIARGGGDVEDVQRPHQPGHHLLSLAVDVESCQPGLLTRRPTDDDEAEAVCVVLPQHGVEQSLPGEAGSVRLGVSCLQQDQEVAGCHLRPQLLYLEIVRIVGEVKPGVVDLHHILRREASPLGETVMTVLCPAVEEAVLVEAGQLVVEAGGEVAGVAHPTLGSVRRPGQEDLALTGLAEHHRPRTSPQQEVQQQQFVVEALRLLLVQDDLPGCGGGGGACEAEAPHNPPVR